MMKEEATGIEATQHSKGTNQTSESSVASPQPEGFSAKWTATIRRIHVPILKSIHFITQTTARNPKSMVSAVVVFCIGIFVLGFLTNFNVDVDEDVIWIPRGSPPVRNKEWIDEESGFASTPKAVVMILHSGGSEDILGRDEVRSIFEAVDAVRDLPDYASICAPYGCNVTSVTKFWDNNVTLFEETTSSDQDVVLAMSADAYPDGTPVSDRELFGTPKRNDNGTLVSAKSYTVSITLPEDKDDTEDESVAFEKEVLDTVLELAEDRPEEALQIEIISDRSFPDEFERSIVRDLPLLPTVFVIMGVFTASVFFKKDKVRSRSLLGFTAVISVLLSILGGYGFMFLLGVPFTSMTQILPFVFFGVGLDDSFIITGSYMRLDHIKDPTERIRVTMDDIGMSIFLTTLTSSLAFSLGCLSSIPAIIWLCVYAVPTIIVILLVQLTFFTGCLVLDERRIQAGNRDCWRCLSCRKPNVDDDAANAAKETMADRFMGWYAEKLLQPVVQGLVIASFVALAVVCAISMTKLKQAFEFTDVLPGDSYIIPFLDAFDDYSERSSVVTAAYFRDVDQSDPEIQLQMENYIKEMSTIDAIAEEPKFFWLRDFKTFANDTSTNVADLSFTQQLDAFLGDPVYGDIYEDSIVRDDKGNVIASRCTIFMDNVDIEDVNNQIDALKDQRAITDAQAINKDQKDARFFLYGADYGIWEFYSRSASEIVATTVLSMVAVTGVTFMFVPHWSAALFVLPLICVLYVDLLGVMQWAGVSINPISYIALVMSVGLLVDFILHVLFRYYEASGSRREKTIDMLTTMGSSILVGAVTTFLGTMPLAFSTNGIFGTIFVAFIALVALGGTHGLILLPVLLSIIGPEDDDDDVVKENPRTTLKETDDPDPENDMIKVADSFGEATA